MLFALEVGSVFVLEVPGGGEFPGDENGDGVRLESCGRDRLEPYIDAENRRCGGVNSWP
jgi:hypothetical protein